GKPHQGGIQEASELDARATLTGSSRCGGAVAHPPGYPLFTLLARFSMCLLPSFSPAHSVNLMSSLLGAAACGCLCITVCRYEIKGPGPGAVLAAGLFAVSRLSWQWSMVAEVFSLNNLFIGLLFFLTSSFQCAENSTQRRKVIARWGALCCGLGLCNQHTLVLYVMVIIPWIFYRLYTLKELSFVGLISLGLSFLTGFLPYLYLPVSSYLNAARWSWGDQTTLSGLLNHLLRTEYGTFSLIPSLCSLLPPQSSHCWYLSPNDRTDCVCVCVCVGHVHHKTPHFQTPLRLAPTPSLQPRCLTDKHTFKNGEGEHDRHVALET
uniref:Transmembrane protein 260 n=1 Tax=Nothobranchius furzeri TaxID=105023 RepID=A0A8C6PJR6_NOTFU